MNVENQTAHETPLKLGLFFTNTEKDYNKSAASTWIRIWQMIETYKQLGIDVSLNNFIKRHDVAIVFRKSKRKYYWILKYLKLTSKTVYFDTCINIFEENEEISPERKKYAHKIGLAADGIICASNEIARFSSPYAKSVFSMEDPINLNHFNRTKPSINFENPVFGWSGVGSKSVFLNRFAQEIDKNIILISENNIKKVELKFSYHYIKWKYENFSEDLLKCDIALLPRDINSSYNKGHSSFKALVFAVSGIPIIANKVPSYIDLSNHYDGIVFLEDYGNNLQACISELKTRLLHTRQVRSHYSCENQAILLKNYLESNLSIR